MEDKEIKLLEEYLEEARDENSFTDCEGLFEDKFFISLDKLLKRYKELEEEVESQDKTIDNLIKEQEEREKYTHSLVEENESLVRQYEYQGALMVNEYFSKEQVFKHFIPISVIQNKKRELEKKKEYLRDEYDEGVVEILCRYSCAIKTLDELLEERNK